ncbi:hypothetical protein ES703_63641 [subsurface metagenome]
MDVAEVSSPTVGSAVTTNFLMSRVPVGVHSMSTPVLLPPMRGAAPVATTSPLTVVDASTRAAASGLAIASLMAATTSSVVDSLVPVVSFSSTLMAVSVTVTINSESVVVSVYATVMLLPMAPISSAS